MSDSDYLSGFENGKDEAIGIVLEILRQLGVDSTEMNHYFVKYYALNYHHKCSGCDKFLRETWLDLCDECEKEQT